MTLDLRRIIIGAPLPSARQAHERLSKVLALAVFSSDALSSVAYATEEILLVLVLAGTGALVFSLPIAVAIVLLLAIVATSYYQTVHGYPSGGGAYIVAMDNLGEWPGLTAGAALLIDYVLTVAVSVTAGVAALTSAFPPLLHYRIWLGVVAIAFVAWANLRGVRESGKLFAVPTYGFLLVMLALIAVGLIRLATGHLQPVEPAEPHLTGVAQSLTAFLLLRAFASGCAAMTGVEAISNGIPAFSKPEADNAGKTLVTMAVLLGTIFLGITVLARGLRVVPAEHETVVSQIGRQVFGTGSVYFVLQAATALVLLLAANTSFADFPRLSAILARDRYLPRQFTNLGDRLVFGNGIIALALIASLLVIGFGGQTHRLIPLYAVGVFLSFTLSQTGMVMHWRKAGTRGWQWRATVNGLGAAATGVVLCVIAVAKFAQGAWIVLLLIPAVVLAFRFIKRHYLTLADQLSLDGLSPERWADLATHQKQKVIVPVSGIHRGTLGALRFARSLSTDVTAVIVDTDSAATARVLDRWPTWGHDVPLVVLESPYRSTLEPLLTYLEEVDQRERERGLAVVVMPEFVRARWWQELLHNQTARLIRRALLYERGKGSKDRVVIDVPYHLHE